MCSFAGPATIPNEVRHCGQEGLCWLLIKAFLLEEGRKGSRAEGCQQLMGGPWESQGICWVHKLGFCLAVTSHSFCVQNVQNSNVLNLRIRVQTEAAVKHIIWCKVVKEQKWLRTRTFPESLQTNVWSLWRICFQTHFQAFITSRPAVNAIKWQRFLTIIDRSMRLLNHKIIMAIYLARIKSLLSLATSSTKYEI